MSEFSYLEELERTHRLNKLVPRRSLEVLLARVQQLDVRALRKVMRGRIGRDASAKDRVLLRNCPLIEEILARHIVLGLLMARDLLDDVGVFVRGAVTP